MRSASLIALVILTAACSDGSSSADRGIDRTQYSSDKDDTKKDSKNSTPKKNADPSSIKEFKFTDSAGISSSYKVNPPADASEKEYGLHIHLHGDGGGGYRDFPNKELRYGLIGVTVKSPAEDVKWGRELGTPHGNFLNELIQNELLKKYKIDPKRIYFSTVSGGSHFMTGVFIPNYGHIYNSKAFVMCGGIAPLTPFKDPTVLSKFRIHWHTTTGEREDIAIKIKNSIEGYAQAAKDHGVEPDVLAKLQSSRVTGPGAHCWFDDKSYKSGIQQEIDKSFQAAMGL